MLQLSGVAGTLSVKKPKLYYFGIRSPLYIQNGLPELEMVSWANGSELV